MTEFYKNIPSESMTDFYDFYHRIATNLPKYCTVAEVGIANGRSGIMLAEMLTAMGKEFTLYLIDNMDYGHENQVNDVIGYIIKSGMGNNIKLLQKSSLDASCEFPDNHFHFVFIDASHKYQHTKADIRNWYYKIFDEGILAGHDYFSKENPEVAMAVNEVIPKMFTRAEIPDQQTFQPEQVLFTEDTTNGHGVWYCKKKWYINLR